MRLEGYLKDELQKYFISYSPVQYARTGNTVKSIKVTNPRNISSIQWIISIIFDESLAYTLLTWAVDSNAGRCKIPAMDGSFYRFLFSDK
ncbi:hypothetical protein [Bacillus sp. JJ722]|uniref:hypothetical protein n=1 Tax=Bacillus sp. JJ722 TaxID=3122973 RepID=UPI002FFE92E6